MGSIGIVPIADTKGVQVATNTGIKWSAEFALLAQTAVPCPRRIRMGTRGSKEERTDHPDRMIRYIGGIAQFENAR